MSKKKIFLWLIAITFIGFLFIDNPEKSTTENNEKSLNEKTVVDSTKIRENAILDSIQKVKNQNRIDSLQAAEAEQKIKDDIKKYQSELADIKSFDGKKFRGTVQSLNIEVALFATWGRMIKDTELSKNETIKNLGKKMKYALVKLQKSEFPKIRNKYVKLMGNKLWREDIDVSGYKTTITFTGGVFASNRNIDDTQSAIIQTLRDYRFKKVKYKWYEDAREYTYYDISSSKDGEIKTY